MTCITTGDARCAALLFDEPLVIRTDSIEAAADQLVQYLRDSWRGDPEVLNELQAETVVSMLTEYLELPDPDMIAMLAEWKNAEVMRETDPGGHMWRRAGSHDGDYGWLPFRTEQIDQALYQYVKEHEQ